MTVSDAPVLKRYTSTAPSSQSGWQKKVFWMGAGLVVGLLLLTLLLYARSDSEAPQAAGTAAAHPSVGTPTAGIQPGHIWIGEGGATFGTMPNMEPGKSEPVPPDFVAVSSRDGLTLVGYVRTSELRDPSAQLAQARGEGSNGIPVFGDDGRTVTGVLIGGKGFVANGEDPAAIPDRSEAKAFTSSGQ